MQEAMGIDIHEDYLTKFDVCGDIRNLSKIFPKKSFDCCICIDVIEHLSNIEGINLMEAMENIARRKVIIFTPLKWSANEDSAKNPKHWSFGNPYQLHRSLWCEKDFTSKGYIRLKTVYDKDYIIVVKEVPRK